MKILDFGKHGKYLGMYAFAFLLPLDQRISTIFIFVWLLYVLAVYRPVSLKIVSAFYLPVALFLAYAVSWWFSQQQDAHFLERKASLLAFPLVFILQGAIPGNVRVRTFHFFVWGCVAALLYCESLAVYRAFLYPEKVAAIFSGPKFSDVHQTVYMAMYLTMGLLILYFFPLKQKLLNRLVIVFYCIGLLQIANRASLLILLLFSLAAVWFSVKNTRKAWIAMGLIGLVFGIIVLGVPRFRKTARKVVEQGFTVQSQDSTSTNYTMRLISWSAALSIIKENPIRGAGVGNAQQALNEAYRKAGHTIAYNRQYNPHNTYLSLWLELGAFGLLWLAVFFFSLYRFALHDENHRGLIIGFMPLLAVNFLFESMFSRYSGISFIIFFFCLLTAKRHENT